MGRAEATEKIQTANNELTAQRDAWANEKRALESKVSSLETEKGELQKQADAKSSDPGMAAQFRAQQEQINKQQEELTSLKTELTTERQTNKSNELKSAVLSAAASKENGKIAATDPEAVFTLMHSKNLVGHNDNGDAFYYKLNEKNETVSATVGDAVSDFLGKHQYLQAPSGKTGSGSNHDGSGGGGSDWSEEERDGHL